MTLYFSRQFWGEGQTAVSLSNVVCSGANDANAPSINCTELLQWRRLKQLHNYLAHSVFK